MPGGRGGVVGPQSCDDRFHGGSALCPRHPQPSRLRAGIRTGLSFFCAGMLALTICPEPPIRACGLPRAPSNDHRKEYS